MRLVALVFWLQMSAWLQCSIFVYKSEDGPSVKDYDCVDHQSTPYCRRPAQPIALERDGESHRCLHNGTSHSFRSVRSANVTVHTLLQHWRSTIDRVDEYAHYLQQPVDTNEGDKLLCECIDPQSFGKNCEYLLPFGASFSDIVNAKFSVNAGKAHVCGRDRLLLDTEM